MKKILLISNSINNSEGYLDHCFHVIKKIMKNHNEILFIPFALRNWDEYEQIAKKRFSQSNIVLSSIHKKKNYKKALQAAEAIFIGGGNTFRLLKELKKHSLLDLIRKRVKSGKLIYIGASAGVNVACPTIKTTNDMPIVELNNLRALNLIPFQINPHYIDTDPLSIHMGETREKRLKEYLEENTAPVVALREGSWLEIRGKAVQLCGKTGGKIFERQKKPYEVNINSDISFLLK